MVPLPAVILKILLAELVSIESDRRDAGGAVDGEDSDEEAGTDDGDDEDYEDLAADDDADDSDGDGDGGDDDDGGMVMRGLGRPVEAGGCTQGAAAWGSQARGLRERGG